MEISGRPARGDTWRGKKEGKKKIALIPAAERRGGPSIRPSVAFKRNSARPPTAGREGCVLGRAGGGQQSGTGSGEEKRKKRKWHRINKVITETEKREREKSRSEARDLETGDSASNRKERGGRLRLPARICSLGFLWRRFSNALLLLHGGEQEKTNYWWEFLWQRRRLKLSSVPPPLIAAATSQINGE